MLHPTPTGSPCSAAGSLSGAVLSQLSQVWSILAHLVDQARKRRTTPTLAGGLTFWMTSIFLESGLIPEIVDGLLVLDGLFVV